MDTRPVNTNPAIVTRAGAQRLPRLALLALCAAYVLMGFAGRSAWKSADMTAVGYMAELARQGSDWWHPTLLGQASDQGALLPYWLGAWMMNLSPDADPTAWWVRLPFALFLVLSMAASWYGTYFLARSESAQPISFAFGGQAAPADYARTMADGGLLALIACLGLAQLAHETTPELVQMGFVTVLFAGISAMPVRTVAACVAVSVGLLGLTLSGAPALALVLGAGALLFELHQLRLQATQTGAGAPRAGALTLALAMAASAALATLLHLWRWKVSSPPDALAHWHGYGQLLLWFTWPAWPLSLWTLWVWRKHIFSRHVGRHLALPLWFVLVTLSATWWMEASDHTLLLCLPAMATLAALALPTLKRQVASLIDWFTLLFFTGCGIVVWVHCIAMLTGFPANPATNIARLAPGFEAHFSWWALLMGLTATAAWGLLVHWRVGRHRPVLWRSLVLPAGGAAWCWTLLMSMGLPLLDYTQSYDSWARLVALQIQSPGCVTSQNLDSGQAAALRWIGQLPLKSPAALQSCPWMLVAPSTDDALPDAIDTSLWEAKTLVRHPSDGHIAVWVLKRR